MHPVKVNLPSNIEQLKIEIFSDLHIGSPKCNYSEIQERVKRVEEDENTYAILLGDIINNSTKTSVGDVYEEELTPMQQIQQAVKIFEPIRTKILAVTSGNHERRSYKQDGIDLLYFMCSELRISERYDYTSCLLFLRFGTFDRVKTRKLLYTIYITHGDGAGGRLVGSKANALSRRGAIIDADIVVSGHTHQEIVFRETSFKVDVRNNGYYKHEQVFVNASATLEYEAYAELYGMRPSSIVSPVLVLNGRVKRVDVIA